MNEASKLDKPEQNHLVEETSPYLLQHRHNPVHWWPWGTEAFQYARQTGRPVLLSVGYAACHWCHVMAHESFEDESIAQVMNDLFVNIKVDREERPDVDALYMHALQSLEGHGGWPLTMFLTPEAEPFWGGTYFPNTSKYGRPGFTDVLREVARVYNEEADKVTHNAALLRQALEPRGAEGEIAPISMNTIEDVAKKIAAVIDPINGGLQGAPKFPNTSIFALVWRAGIRFDIEICRRAIDLTLTRICQGGIYDHLGGGFARYTVDERWLVPHFEKMLYDNAQLLDMLTELWKETRNPLYAERASETVGWLEREMIAPDGGFASSLDADSEGEEGKFYVWNYSEIVNILGSNDAELFTRIYDVTPEGNWEGENILNRLKHPDHLSAEEEQRLAEMRGKLFASRETRVRPGWDDKVLADWNGLMIAALARAGTAFQRPAWTKLARNAYDFVKTRMSAGRRMQHSYRAGQTSAPGIATDYANMISALALYLRTDRRNVYLDDALAGRLPWIAHFWSEDYGGYYLSADDTDRHYHPHSQRHDDATPNANAGDGREFHGPFPADRRSRLRKTRPRDRTDLSRRDRQEPCCPCRLPRTASMTLTEPQHVAIIG